MKRAVVAFKAQNMTGNGQPLISVIVAVFDGAKTLQRCIDSVATQTYGKRELVVIDGGSSDGSVAIIERNKHQIAYWESTIDLGIYHAWNKALDHAKGEWICFLGADDYFWGSDSLSRMVPDLCHAYPAYRVVYGRVAIVNFKGETLQICGEPWEKARKRFLEVMSIPQQGVLHHQSLFECHGHFNESFSIAADYELLLRELKDHDAFFVANVILSSMQQGGISSNPHQSLKLLQEMHIARKSCGFVFPGWYWSLSFVKVSIRVLLWQILGEARARKMLDIGRRMLGKPPYWTRT